MFSLKKRLNTAMMKPLPSDKEAFSEEARSLGLLGPNPSLENPRANLLKCIQDSMKIKRSFNHVSILLAGASGVGKSSTVNHLLGIDLAGTGSETRSTKEFVVHVDDPKYEVEGLSLGLIDTPGVCDTDGHLQDACNFLSMQKFFRTRPTLSDCYPNLVFLFMKATDKRYMGNSEFRKSLRYVEELNLVDPKNPNIVIILTHACSIRKRTEKEWTDELNKIKSNVSRFVFDVLNVSAPVVLIENGYEECKLKRCGDYTRLPNGELQPKNLYEACASVLRLNSDSLGLITLNNGFTLESPNHHITTGHKIEAKNARQYTLDSEEEAMVEFIREPVVKPLPPDKRALFEEAQSLGLLRLNPILDKPRAKLIECIQSSMKIRRSPNHVSIVLVGKTGAGKSATVNHLLGVDLAETNKFESETRSTKEFIVHGSDSKYEVEGLSLGLVDTPGFSDTDGRKQDACNLLCMRKFFRTHPTLSKCYPNLVFVVLKADDKRYMGKDSEFRKSLRCVKQLNLVDPKNPNVVIILTHACSIQKRTDKIWTETLDEIRSNVSKVVFGVLNVSAPVVLIENMYEDCGLERCGDYTRLRNGELQPKNLYDACASVLNDDSLGLITLNSIFGKSKESRHISLGHESEAMKQCTLNSEESRIVELFENVAKEGFSDPFYNAIFQCTDKQNFKGPEVEEMMKIVEVLRSLGEGNPPNFGSHSLHSIELYLGKEISPAGRQRLQENFNIKVDPPRAPLESGRLIGQGYNILTDKSVATQVMKFDVTTKYGIAIPTCAKFEKVEQSRSFMEEFQDEESYIQSRMKSLNVNLAVKPNIFKIECRAGYNKKNDSTSSSSMLQYSFLFEQRLFELKLGNYEESLKHGMGFTEDFKSAVAKLPSAYDKSNPSCVSTFERFFNRFGHFLVSSAYGGGSVEVKCNRETVESKNTNLTEAKTCLAATLEGFDLVEGSFSAGSGSPDNQETKALLEQSSLSWQGGDAALQTRETIGDQKKLQKWKESLTQNPMMLTSELTLEPISTAVGCVDSQRDQATYEALKDLLESEIKIPDRNDKESFVTEMRKRAKNATTRKETLKDPNQRDGKCFPSSSVVQVQSKDGEVKQKKMANLDVGDKVMAWDEKRNRTVFSKVMMFAHLALNAMSVEYLKITLEDGNKIALSGDHLVMVGKQKKAVLARKVKPGDFLFSVDENHEISPKKVLAVEKVMEQGIYCPITVHGNVIVDNVLASCYASVEDHVLLKGLVKISAQSMAHLGLMPMRALHKLRSKWLRNIPNGQTIHPYLQWLCELNLPWMAN